MRLYTQISKFGFFWKLFRLEIFLGSLFEINRHGEALVENLLWHLLNKTLDPYILEEHQLGITSNRVHSCGSNQIHCALNGSWVRESNWWTIGVDREHHYQSFPVHRAMDSQHARWRRFADALIPLWVHMRPFDLRPSGSAARKKYSPIISLPLNRPYSLFHTLLLYLLTLIPD